MCDFMSREYRKVCGGHSRGLGECEKAPLTPDEVKRKLNAARKRHNRNCRKKIRRRKKGEPDIMMRSQRELSARAAALHEGR